MVERLKDSLFPVMCQVSPMEDLLYLRGIVLVNDILYLFSS